MVPAALLALRRDLSSAVALRFAHGPCGSIQILKRSGRSPCRADSPRTVARPGHRAVRNVRSGWPASPWDG